MKRTELLTKIDAAIRSRNPKLKEQLCRGLSKDALAKKLSKVPGGIEPLVDLYSWHNGTEPQRFQDEGRFLISFEDLSVVPCELLIFHGIDMMLAHFGSWSAATKAQPFLKKVAGTCFPFLWDGSTTWLGLDLNSKSAERVLVVDFESDKPVREAYPSFDECLEDILFANQNGVQMRFQ